MPQFIFSTAMTANQLGLNPLAGWQYDPVQAGGTAGFTPSELNTPADAWIGAGGDRLKLVIDEVAGGTPTVDGIIIANPA